MRTLLEASPNLPQNPKDQKPCDKSQKRKAKYPEMLLPGYRKNLLGRHFDLMQQTYFDGGNSDWNSYSLAKLKEELSEFKAEEYDTYNNIPKQG